jgi:hypothetical protein
VIAKIPLKKKKSSCEGLPDNQNSTVKRGRVCEKRLCESLNPIVKGIPTEKAWDNNKLWPKIPSTKGFPPKRPETTKSCGLKSHPQRDSHRKGSRQQ